MSDDPTTRGWNGARMVNTIRYLSRGKPVTKTLCTAHADRLADEEDLHGDPFAHVGPTKVGRCEHPNHSLVRR